jgi:hypothetical protein
MDEFEPPLVEQLLPFRQKQFPLERLPGYHRQQLQVSHLDILEEAVSDGVLSIAVSRRRQIPPAKPGA